MYIQLTLSLSAYVTKTWSLDGPQALTTHADDMCSLFTYHLSALVTLSTIVFARWVSNSSTGLPAPKREWVRIMKAQTRSSESM